jgi:Ca2+-binding RTX toxin-like protein
VRRLLLLLSLGALVLAAPALAARIDGTGGDDRLTGTRGADRMSGFKGNDRLAGRGGADRMFGNSGRDRLDGGAGRDRLRGGSGDDRLVARDGFRDVVDCGSGRADRATVDRLDRVRGCERVAR